MASSTSPLFGHDGEADSNVDDSEADDVTDSQQLNFFELQKFTSTKSHYVKPLLPLQSNERRCSITVDIFEQFYGPLKLLDDDGNFSPELLSTLNDYPDIASKRLASIKQDDATQASVYGEDTLYFVGKEWPARETGRVMFIFSMPKREIIDDDTQRNYRSRFPFIPRRGECVKVVYKNVKRNQQRVQLLMDPYFRAHNRLDERELVVLSSVRASRIDVLPGYRNRVGMVQKVDRCPERILIKECRSAHSDALGEVFIEGDSVDDCENVILARLHVGDRILFSAVRNLHKNKYPLRPIRITRQRFLAGSALGIRAADITVESGRGYGTTTLNARQFTRQIKKGEIVSLVIAVSPHQSPDLAEHEVQIEGYRILPENAADTKTTLHGGGNQYELVDDLHAIRRQQTSEERKLTRLHDSFSLSYLDRSCLFSTRPWLVDGEANRRERLVEFRAACANDDLYALTPPIPAGFIGDDATSTGSSQKMKMLKCDYMYPWKCCVTRKQTAKLQLKFIAARTGRFRANFALLTNNAEVLVPINIDVVDAPFSANIPRLLNDTGCFRQQSYTGGMRHVLSFDDKFNLYALRHYLHASGQIGWFDRRGQAMRDASQYTTLDCRFGVKFILHAKGHLRRPGTDAGLAGITSMLLNVNEYAELSPLGSTDADFDADDADADYDPSSPRRAAAAGKGSDDDDSDDNEIDAKYMKNAITKPYVTPMNFVRLYKLQLQNEAIWRSWQYMEASLRNPRMRLGSRYLYIEMSANRSFLSHVQRVDDKCFAFLYYMEDMDVAGGATTSSDVHKLPEMEPNSPQCNVPQPFIKLSSRTTQSQRSPVISFAMIALAITKIANNEVVCCLPENIQLPFVDYSTAPMPTVRPFSAKHVSSDADSSKTDENQPQLQPIIKKYTVYVSFKTLMINLKRSYDALDLVRNTSLQATIARFLFPTEVQNVMPPTHAQSQQQSCSSSLLKNHQVIKKAAFGHRARGSFSSADSKDDNLEPKCVQPNCYPCPLPHCKLKHAANDKSSAVCNGCQQNPEKPSSSNNNIESKNDAALFATDCSTLLAGNKHPFLRRSDIVDQMKAKTAAAAANNDSSSGNSSCSTDENSASVAAQLDSTQQSVLDHVAHGCSRPSPYVLIGPPGTGKTRTLVNAILQTFKLEPQSRLLVVASSNVAADLLYTLLTTGRQDVCMANNNEGGADDCDDDDEDSDDAGTDSPLDAAELTSGMPSIVNSPEPQPSPTELEYFSIPPPLNAADRQTFHRSAPIVSADLLLQPIVDIVRLYSDEHARSSLIAANVKSDGIGLVCNEVRDENDEKDDLEAAQNRQANYKQSTANALKARVCVCTPTLAAHLYRQIFEVTTKLATPSATPYVGRDHHYRRSRRPPIITHICYRNEPYTHLFVDEAGKCAEAELIVPLLTLNLVPLLTATTANMNGHDLRNVLVVKNELQRRLATAQMPLVLLAGDPYQLGPNAVLKCRGDNNVTSALTAELSNDQEYFLPASMPNDPAAADGKKPLPPQAAPEMMLTWNSVTTSLLTRMFVQYGYTLRRQAATEFATAAAKPLIPVKVMLKKLSLHKKRQTDAVGDALNWQQQQPVPNLLMTVLRNNYRNPRIIAEFLSQHFYHGHIVSLVSAAPPTLPSIVFVSHRGQAESNDEGPSIYNVEEARIVADLAINFIARSAAYADNDVESFVKLLMSFKSLVAILTPYRNQSVTIRIQLFRALHELIEAHPQSDKVRHELTRAMLALKYYSGSGHAVNFYDVCLPVVATIDEFQGREADNIILSVVRSRQTVPASLDFVLFKHFGDYPIGNAETSVEERRQMLAKQVPQAEREEVCERYLRKCLGFVADDTRINEAITRACRRLFIVGNKSLLQLYPTWRELLKCAQVYEESVLDSIVLQ